MHDDLATVLDKVEAGDALDDGDWRALTSGHDLIALGMAADAARRRRHGDRTTFVQVAPVPVAAPTLADAVAPDAGEVRLTGRPETSSAAVAAVRALAARTGGRPSPGSPTATSMRCAAATPPGSATSSSSCGNRGWRG